MIRFVSTLNIVALIVVGGCSSPNPLGDLTVEDKQFLFADTGTNAPFLGQTLDGGPLNCYPQRMNQGYVFVDTKSDLWLDSIRPSGVERHKILSVKATQRGFVVKAQNGVTVPFELHIQRQGTDMATISWDGAPSEMYRRCAAIGG
jgi:hypothetical protein